MAIECPRQSRIYLAVILAVGVLIAVWFFIRVSYGPSFLTPGQSQQRRTKMDLLHFGEQFLVCPEATRSFADLLLRANKADPGNTEKADPSEKNPFPKWLRGDFAWWQGNYPVGANPKRVPVIWDYLPLYADRVNVLFLDGSVECIDYVDFLRLFQDLIIELDGKRNLSIERSGP